jgi:hypothetical protein
MINDYHEFLRDVFEVFSEACIFFYNVLTIFEYFIYFLEQYFPLFQLLIPLGGVLLGRVNVSLELIATLLAVNITLIRTRFDTALVLLDLASATAYRQFHRLSLISIHFI